MDEAVVKFYRLLLKQDFPNSGELEDPSIFVEAVGEKLINCGNTGNYMQLYLNVEDQKISEIKYLCSCEPVANVAVEVLCNLVKGRPLAEASTLNEESFYELIGSTDVDLCKKVRGLIELLKEGINGWHTDAHGKKSESGDNGKPAEKLSWDGTLSS